MKKEWSDKPLRFKIATVSSLVVSFSLLVLSVLQLFDVWNDAAFMCGFLWGIYFLLHTYIQWNTNRKLAIFALCATAFAFAFVAAVYIIKCL